MKISLGRVIILVEDYDEAFNFYQKNFFCEKLYDSTSPEGQRFLHIKFPNDDDAGIWFLKADTPEQKSNVGNQTGGQPVLVLYTQEIDELYNLVRNNRVRIIKELVNAPGSRFFHCLDLYGNKITVVELT